MMLEALPLLSGAAWACALVGLCQLLRAYARGMAKGKDAIIVITLIVLADFALVVYLLERA